MALGNKFAGERVVPRDLGAPVHVPYIFQEYPKCLYHPIKKTEASIHAKQKAENHNVLHPANPQFVPELQPLTLIVNNKEEERKAFGSGFIDKAPNPDGWESTTASIQQDEIEDAPVAVEPEPEFKFTTAKRRKK